MINSESCIFRMKLFQMKMFQVRFMLRTGVHSVEMNHDGFSSFLYPLKSEFKFATHDTSIRFNFMFRMKLSQMKKFNWRNSSEIHVTITCYIAVRFRSTLIIFSSTSPLHSNTVLTAKTRSRIIITSRGEFSSWNKHTFALGCDSTAGAMWCFAFVISATALPAVRPVTEPAWSPSRIRIGFVAGARERRRSASVLTWRRKSGKKWGFIWCRQRETSAMLELSPITFLDRAIDHDVGVG